MRGISCRFRLLALLAVTLVCWGQTQNQAPRRTVTGTVVNALSGEPIRHALIRIGGARSFSALSGPDGRFEIRDVPEGPVNFGVSKPGFFDSRSLSGNEWGHGSPLVVGSGNNDFRLTLYPAGKIAGRITDPDGEAVERTQIQVLSEQIVQGRKQWQVRNISSTDEDGSYRIDDLLPGRYIVFVSGNMLTPRAWNAPHEVSAPAYYPDARELVSAQPIEIRAGEEFRADFHLHIERGFRISGNISGIPGDSYPGLAIENSTGQRVSLQGVRLDQSRGKFAVEAVPSGTWILAVSANDRQGHAYEARQEVTVDGADIADLPIVLHPPISIPLTVNHAAGHAEPPNEQGVVNPGVSATLISTDAFNVRQYWMQSGDGNGALEFVNVAPGKYKLDVQSYGSECLESAYYGDVDVTRDYLVVSSDNDTRPVTINLRSDCATLSAKIAPGEGETSGFLLVMPSSSFGSPKMIPIGTPSALLPMRGFPQLSLSPGSYEVFALSSLEGLEYSNPEALRDYPSQSINLSPGQKAEIAVKISKRKGTQLAP